MSELWLRAAQTGSPEVNPLSEQGSDPPVLPSIKDKCVTCVCADTSTNVDVVVQATLCQNAQPPPTPRPDRPIPVSCQLPYRAATSDNKCMPSPVSPTVLSQFLQGYDE